MGSPPVQFSSNTMAEKAQEAALAVASLLASAEKRAEAIREEIATMKDRAVSLPRGTGSC
jgi:hypothetical protein